MMQDDAWYRQTWPWVLIAIPLSAVLFGVVMVMAVVMHPDDVVVDDYYQDGMAINREFGWDREAKRLGVHGRWLSSTTAGVSFRIDGADDSVVVVQFFHVTDSARDARLLLYPDGDGTYSTTLPMPVRLDEPGIWYVEMHGVDHSWRLRRRIETPITVLELEPNA
jgi:uncharacterized protein